MQASTTTAFARLLRNLLARSRASDARVVPIIPDEARTFGLDALFREFKIYAPFGQRYEPVDAELLLSYREAKNGRILEEGITEAGVDGVVHRGGHAYATWGQPMIPFFIFYSMFGFQRVGDLIWSFGDQRGRGFLLGATAGRTTLTGEGLQHCDGQSQVLASAVPNCRAYDPAFAYEMAVIIRDGIERMYGARARGLLLLPHPLQRELRRCRRCPRASRTASCAGSTGTAPRAASRGTHRAQILASGTAMRAALDAQELLAERVRRRRRRVERDELQAAARGRARAPSGGTGCTRPTPARTPYVTEQLGDTEGPIVAVTDFMKAVPDQIARFVPAAVRPARHRRLRLLRHARPRCAATSRSTPRTSWSRCSTGSRPGRGQDARWWPRRSAAYDIDPPTARIPRTTARDRHW